MNRRTFLSLAATAPLLRAAAPAIDWTQVQSETLEHFSALLKLDTRNPPGNETRAAKYLLDVLKREGVPAQLYALEESRANLVARVKGSGAKKPLLIMGHTDVVGVQEDRWTVDPFGAVRKDGFIYGRGATDDKDNVVACLMSILLLKRHGVKLDRDVIFLAESGEEGTTHVGIKYMVEQQWAAIEAEYALAEGGGGVLRNGKPVYMAVSTAEKSGRGVWLKARGTAGHGSTPRLDNAVIRLANAVSKVGAWRTPIRLNDTTRAYFEKLATISTPDAAERYNGILSPAKQARIDQFFAENELMHHSMLRTSIAPTMVRGGFRANVIPSEVEAYLDIRALPDEDLDKFYKELAAVINDPNVEVSQRSETDLRPKAPPSPLDNEAYRALEAAQKRVYPGAITIPNMMTGATDMAYLRAKGVHSYGIGPLTEEAIRNTGGAHSDDERVSEASLHSFVRYMWEAVQEIAAVK